MHRHFLLAGCLLLASAALAGEPGPGPVSGSTALLAATCGNCHGTDGRTAAAIPALAGQNTAYLQEALQTYKDGSRPATIMHQLARGYSEAEIAALADHFSRLKP